MTTKELVGSILVTGVPLLVSIIALVKPIINLNTSITHLNDAVKSLAEKFDVFENNNHSAHQRLWQKNEEQDNTLSEHDKRIALLESNK